MRGLSLQDACNEAGCIIKYKILSQVANNMNMNNIQYNARTKYSCMNHIPAVGLR